MVTMMAIGHSQSLASEIVRWTGLWDPLCETTPGSRHLFSFQLYSKDRQVENVKIIKPKMTPLVIAWYSLLQSSGQCGSSFSRTCATRLFRRFSGKLFVGTMTLFIFLKLHNSYQSCISSLAAIVDKPPSWRSMSATVIPAFPHWPNSGQCWEIL